ncbi:MAG: hypothetical protein M1835_005339 [Candelina submexicana]|nr:MAG: hypothetical protein M1835_005339 [Candelina submexicana]
MSPRLKPPVPAVAKSYADARDSPERMRPLSRSPHPYHRRQVEPLSVAKEHGTLSHSTYTHSQQSPSLTPPSSASDQDGIPLTDSSYSPRKPSTSPSDSGTEADDESFRFLKRLPAPPLRPKKGLKDAKDPAAEGTLSPLLTPSFLKGEHRNFSRDFEIARQDEAESYKESEEGRRRVKERYKKRRQAEIIRRGSEIVLLGAIGGIVICGEAVRQTSRDWHRELLGLLGATLALFVLYPFRLLYYMQHTTTKTSTKLWRRLRIPSTFDPAPLLYPTLLPVYVALSVLPTMQQSLLTNCILSIASLPSELIPFLSGVRGYSSTHWLISVIPLFIISEKNTSSFKSLPLEPYINKFMPSKELDPEDLICLYPLHRALLPVLEYLTTTSLLPAELQLFSISLINVLLQSSSPHAIILKSLIWGGGVGIFILCGHVLRWGVALARVPRWRLRRAGQVIRARNAFLEVLDKSLKQPTNGLLSLMKSTDGSSSSDAEVDERVLRSSSTGRRSLVVDVRVLNGRKSSKGKGQSSTSPSEKGGSPHAPFANGSADVKAEGTIQSRRHTLSSFERKASSLKASKTTPSGRRKRSRSSATQSYLALTLAQATVRKWLYAIYVYSTILLLVFVGIGGYVSQRALNHNNPIGWALGYLFGNLHWFRLWVVSSRTERWFCLPARNDDSIRSCHRGVVEHLRRDTFGEANTRLLICGYWVGVLAVGMAIVLRLSSVVDVDTRRKVFHGMMVVMFLPTIFVDPAFAGLALTLVLAIFLLLDLFRASQLPPLSRPLAYFLTPYVDGRDLRGPVVVSHIFLLIGCAIPLWLSLAGTGRAGSGVWEGWEVDGRDVSMVSGVICVGMGDAAASLIGRGYGRRKWLWSGGKSLEGSLAFATAVTVGLGFAKAWLNIGGWADDNDDVWIMTFAKAVLAACGASLTEAVLTGGNDNVVVPIILWLLVRGLRI